MNNFSEILRSSRLKSGLKQKEVAVKLNIDMGLLSRIEKGERQATRKQLTSLIDLLNLDEKLSFSAWLSDKILSNIENESYGLDALLLAESEVRYELSQPILTLDHEIKSLLGEADKLQKKWIAKKPLEQSQLKKMKEYFDLNYTFESNKIEGNTLTLQETYLVLNDGLTVGGKSLREHLEAVNHSEAIELIAELIQKRQAISEKILNDLHYLILKGIDKSNAGVYRKVPVLITGSKHKPPQPYLLSRKMEEVFEFYNAHKGKIHPIILAANMHEKIVTIHPYIDGNGRTSRLMMNLVLLMNGFTLAILKGDNKSRLEYYSALESCQVDRSPNKFLKLVINSCIDSLNEHIELAG